jgi:hypothetical protein
MPQRLCSPTIVMIPAHRPVGDPTGMKRGWSVIGGGTEVGWLLVREAE